MCKICLTPIWYVDISALFFGRLTQLGECNPYKVEVAGSSPASPTIKTGDNGGVVQLVRTLACHARGREFESRHSRHNTKRGFWQRPKPPFRIVKTKDSQLTSVPLQWHLPCLRCLPAYHFSRPDQLSIFSAPAPGRWHFQWHQPHQCNRRYI